MATGAIGSRGFEGYGKVTRRATLVGAVGLAGALLYAAAPSAVDQAGSKSVIARTVGGAAEEGLNAARGPDMALTTAVPAVVGWDEVSDAAPRGFDLADAAAPAPRVIAVSGPFSVVEDVVGAPRGPDLGATRVRSPWPVEFDDRTDVAAPRGMDLSPQALSHIAGPGATGIEE